LGKGARSSGCNCSAILDNYEIENPREVWEITSQWLLITGSLTTLCATPTIPVETDHLFYAWYCLSTTLKIHFKKQRF
jgi:hypothetical protein